MTMQEAVEAVKAQVARFERPDSHGWSVKCEVAGWTEGKPCPTVYIDVAGFGKGSSWELCLASLTEAVDECLGLRPSALSMPSYSELEQSAEAQIPSMN